MKFNLSLKVRERGELAFHTLISAGRNWFESKGECEVILAGEAEIDFWKQLPNSREAVIETLELMDLPKRGFAIPITKWLKEPELRGWAESLIITAEGQSPAVCTEAKAQVPEGTD
mgnify:CR=1 FL=1